jgi:SRSO17 transposase
LTVPIEQTFDSLPGWNVQANTSSMPISFRLYLPEVWANDPERRKKAGVPDEITFETKPQIALEQIKRARERGVPQGVVLADAG